MSKFLKILGFFRLLDENAQLSITNIAVIIILARFAINETCDMGSAAAILMALSSYHFKRYLGTKIPQANLDKDSLADMKAQLNKIKLKMGIMPPTDMK